MWSLLADLAATFAAFCAWRAVVAARDQQKETARFWRLERRSAAYVAAVREPLLTAADEFVTSAQALLRSTAREIDELCDENASVDGVQAAVATGIGEFNELFYQLRTRWRRASRCWEAPDLADQLRSIAEALQDGVNQQLASYPQQRDLKRLLDQVTQHVSELEAAVISADPALIDADPPSTWVLQPGKKA